MFYGFWFSSRTYFILKCPINASPLNLETFNHFDLSTLLLLQVKNCQKLLRDASLRWKAAIYAWHKKTNFKPWPASTVLNECHLHTISWTITFGWNSLLLLSWNQWHWSIKVRNYFNQYYVSYMDIWLSGQKAKSDCLPLVGVIFSDLSVIFGINLF